MFCTAGSAALAGAVKAPANIARFSERQLDWGATALEIPARLEYAAARAELARGRAEEAQAHLERANQLAPYWPDPYFTLSMLNFRRFKPDALFFLVGGLRAASHNFHFQTLLAINVLLYAVLLWIVLSTIACIAFALRYLPFAAFRLSEMLRERFHATLPRLAALLALLVPFALFPGFVTGFSFLVLFTWYYMQRREKAFVVALAVPFAALAFFAPTLERLTPAADPASLVSLAARAATAPGDGMLIQQVERAKAPGLDMEQNLVAGVLLTRQENFDAAASRFLNAIAEKPNNAIAYVNLGNVYYLQGLYEKALEGYRKAEQIAPADPVGQYNLAQAYIKTLLLAESSRALKSASAHGIENVKASYGDGALSRAQVFTRTFTPRELWRIASREGRTRIGAPINMVYRPLTGFSVRAGGWVMLGSVLLVVFLGRFVKRSLLAFQCSNCGELTSEGTSNSERGSYICASCAAAIENVSSDKVIEALLRQRRQKVLVRRRQAIRVLTMWIPGVRDFYYGRITRGIAMAGIFSLSAVFLVSHGYIIRDWQSFDTDLPLWKLILPVVGLLGTYIISFFSRHYYEVRNYRTPLLAASRSGESQSTRRRSA